MAKKTLITMQFIRSLTILLLLVVSSFSLVFSQVANNVGPGNSIDFDSSNDRVNLGPVLNNLSLPLTIMAWVKPEPQMTINPVFSSSSDTGDWHGIWLHVASNRIQAALADGDGGFGLASRRVKVASYTNLHNDWFHVTAVIVDSNDIRIYVNGIEQSGSYNGSATQLVNSPTGEADIGYHERGDSGPIEHFNGEIDEVRLWDIALSETQIRDQMCRQVLASEAGLIAAWDLNDAANSNVINDVRGLLNGNRIGNATTVVSSAPVGNSSTYLYGSQTSNSLVLQEPGVDSMVVQANAGTDGIHLYQVDFPPVDQTGLTSGSSIGHYYGVFSVNTTQRFSVNHFLVSPFYTPNIYSLSYRNHNASPSWSSFSGFFAPNVIQFNRGRQEEYIIDGSCVGLGVLPPTFSDCDVVAISIPNTLTSILWDDGDTSRNRVFQQNGTFIISGINQNGCSTLDTVVVQLLSPAFNPMPDQEICESLVVTVDSNLSNIIWDNGSISSQRTIYSSGTYSYQAIDNVTGCDVLDTFQVVKASSNLAIDSLFQANRSYCVGDTLNLSFPSLYRVRWSNDSVVQRTDIFATSSHLVEIEGPCLDTTVFLSYDFYNCDCGLFMANAFTPNGDGLNDKIKPMGNCDLNYYHWQIFNRWGIQVFDSYDFEEYFDGTYKGYQINSSSLFYRLSYSNRFTQKSESGILNIIR
jgi:gliding motility-associated-like protein